MSTLEPGGDRKCLPTIDELQQITASLNGLRFGSVNIIVQDGVVVQIDRTEKRRLRHCLDKIDRATSQHS